VDRTFSYRVPSEIAACVVDGALVRIPFGGRNVRGLVTSDDPEPGEGLEEIAGMVVDLPVAPAPMPQLLEWLALRYATPRGVAFARVVPPRVRVRTSEVERTGAAPVPSRILTYERGDALIDALRARRPSTWSVRVTPDEPRGPLIAELVGAAPGSVLVAVPEVAHGSPTLDALGAAFPDLARVDSALSDMDRARGLMRLAGGARLGAGGRAAVLAPATDLSLIVVADDAHPSFKDDRGPRYEARIVAAERARLSGAVCVFVGASPSVEVASAARAGAIGSVHPSRDVERAARPLTEVLEPPSEGGISVGMQRRIRDALRAGEKVAVVAPRRGYARTLWCSACRRSLRCRRCETALAFHVEPRSLRCPHCGATESPPDVCPHCGASDFRYLGAGSHRFEEQLAKAFPHVPVTRLDVDSPEPVAASDGPSIYVTTYFGIKPSLRPPARLVTVIDGDGMIRRPELRAAETAFHTLVELAGWAGPASGGGHLVVQSTEPHHHVLQALVRADHAFFLERELALREELAYPPFGELVRLTATGPSGPAVMEEAVRSLRKAGERVLGPVAAAEGQEALVKCRDGGVVAERLRLMLPGVPRGTRLRVDVDPR